MLQLELIANWFFLEWWGIGGESEPMQINNPLKNSGLQIIIAERKGLSCMVS